MESERPSAGSIRRILLVSLAGILVPVFLTGCLSPLRHKVDEQTALARTDWAMVRNLAVPKAGEEDCGEQVLTAAWEFTRGETAGGPVLNGPSTPVGLLLSARRAGMAVSLHKGTMEALTDEVSAGRPVIVMLDVRHRPPAFGFVIRGAEKLVGEKRLRRPHWALVSGIARDRSRILLAQPGGLHAVLSDGDFSWRWGKCGNCMVGLE